MVMLIGGFDIQHLLASKCVSLNIPSIRILVERAIEQVKNYLILQGVIPISGYYT